MTIKKILNVPLLLLGFVIPIVHADTIVTVGVAPHGGYVILGGTVIALKDVTLSAQIPGRVEFIAGELGDSFEAGTQLLKVNDDDLQARKEAAEASIATAHNMMQNAQVQYNRELWNPRVYNPRPMAGMGGPSMFDGIFNNFGGASPFGESNNNRGIERHADLVTQGTQLQSARSSITQAESALREIEAKLRDSIAVAPFDGVIMQKLVEVGDTVQPGQPLLVFSYSKFLRIKVEVPSRLAPGLRMDMIVPARLDVNNARVNARVAEISPKANEQQHTITVKFDLPEGVYGGPGMYAEVMVPDINSPTEALPVVPKAAIIKRGSLPSVKVLDENGHPKLRLIRTGIELDADHVIVLSGLEPGERVLVHTDGKGEPQAGWDKPQ